MVQELLKDLFGIKISVGSINQLRQEGSESVAVPVAGVLKYVQGASSVNIDETSFTQGNSDGKNLTGRKGWLWVIATPLVSYACRVFEPFSGSLSAGTGSCLCWHCQQ